MRLETRERLQQWRHGLMMTTIYVGSMLIVLWVIQLLVFK